MSWLKKNPALLVFLRVLIGPPAVMYWLECICNKRFKRPFQRGLFCGILWYVIFTLFIYKSGFSFYALQGLASWWLFWLLFVAFSWLILYVSRIKFNERLGKIQTVSHFFYLSGFLLLSNIFFGMIFPISMTISFWLFMTDLVPLTDIGKYLPLLWMMYIFPFVMILIFSYGAGFALQRSRYRIKIKPGVILERFGPMLYIPFLWLGAYLLSFFFKK